MENEKQSNIRKGGKVLIILFLLFIAMGMGAVADGFWTMKDEGLIPIKTASYMNITNSTVPSWIGAGRICTDVNGICGPPANNTVWNQSGTDIFPYDLDLNTIILCKFCICISRITFSLF